MPAISNFEQATVSITSEVNLLNKLANTIRKAGRDTQNCKAAAAFQIKDEEGNDLERALRWYFTENLKDRFPESSDTIRDRLVSTMILRRKRILYRQSRYSVNPIEAPDPVDKPRDQTLPSLPHQERDNLELHANAYRRSTAPSQVQSAVPSATILASKSFQRASAPSVVSHTKSVDLSAHEILTFPSPPAGSCEGKLDVTCPYCLYILPSTDVVNTEKWRFVAKLIFLWSCKRL
jgi:hypothetical protein